MESTPHRSAHKSLINKSLTNWCFHTQTHTSSPGFLSQIGRVYKRRFGKQIYFPRLRKLLHRVVAVLHTQAASSTLDSLSIQSNAKCSTLRCAAQLCFHHHLAFAYRQAAYMQPSNPIWMKNQMQHKRWGTQAVGAALQQQKSQELRR